MCTGGVMLGMTHVSMRGSLWALQAADHAVVNALSAGLLTWNLGAERPVLDSLVAGGLPVVQDLPLKEFTR